ncbi:MAG: cohesin domain-containing protein [Chloroflexi bacterium]|nr:cohesin domain-containing protein [Chloroflexota bacterium]
MIGTIVLAAGVALLLLLIILGLVVIVMSDRTERRNIVMVVAIVGLVLLLSFCCVGAGIGLAWFFFGATAVAPPPPVMLTPAPLLSSPASISLVPDSPTVAQGESISVTIRLANVTALYGVEVHLTHGEGLSAGGLVPGTCADDFIAQAQIAAGQVDFAAARMPPQPPFSGDCDVASFTLTGNAVGVHTILFDDAILADRDGNPLPVTTNAYNVTVVAAAP